MINPFPISGYEKPEFFCNREDETNMIREHLLNQRNLVLLSLRRLGKTSLIRHLFYQLEQEKEYDLLYVDLDHTSTVADFAAKLLNAILKNSRKSSLRRILQSVKAIRPTMSFDPISGTPEVSLTLADTHEENSVLDSLFDLLESQKKPCIVAFDEFQRITAYPEERVEAQLRSCIQHLTKTHFIFSGSRLHLLRSMFNDHSRPFYQSAAFLELDKIPVAVYADFIHHHFSYRRRWIDRENIIKAIRWADNHTFYVQYLFNYVWGKGMRSVSGDTLLSLQNEILSSRDSMYKNYENLLTERQFALLRAIALEKEVPHPGAGDFLAKYSLHSASTVISNIDQLQDKELIYVQDKNYTLLDPFQMRWFQHYFPLK